MYGVCTRILGGGGWENIVRSVCVCVCKGSLCIESGVGAVATWAEGMHIMFSNTTVHKIDGSFDPLWSGTAMYKLCMQNKTNHTFLMLNLLLDG